MTIAGEHAHPVKSLIRCTDDGLHLGDTILWLDSNQNGDLSFLSSAACERPSGGPQVIATEETIRLLHSSKQHRPNALICQYNRPFSIGRLRMELLPSGSMLGGASLFLETDSGRVLYAPRLQTHKISVVRQMQLKKASTLIISPTHPDPNGVLPNRKKEKERLLDEVRGYVSQGIYPVILCPPLTISQEITRLLVQADLPVAVHRTIHAYNKIHSQFGSVLGNYSMYSPRYTRKKVILFPTSFQWKSAPRFCLPEGPLFIVNEGIHAIRADPNQRVKSMYYLSSTADGRDLREVIAAVGPKEVFVFGPYAKAYCEEFRSLASHISPLYSNGQPTLF